jgi:hypothetical protein
MRPFSSVVPIMIIPLVELEATSSLQISLLYPSSLFLFVGALQQNVLQSPHALAHSPLCLRPSTRTRRPHPVGPFPTNRELNERAGSQHWKPTRTSNANCPVDASPCGLSWCCTNSLTCFVVQSGNDDVAGVAEACCPNGMSPLRLRFYFYRNGQIWLLIQRYDSRRPC